MLADTATRSLAVVDATDATVLPPEQPPAALDERQQEELAKCQMQLSKLGTRIQAREAELIYAYVEAGWWLLRAREAHRVPTVGTRSEGRFTASEDSGFLKWLDSQPDKIARNTAYRWIQGAERVGLTPKSNVTDVWALKMGKSLHGKTLADVCRKPVDKTEKQAEIHEVTEEEEAAERLADLDRVYTSAAQFLAQAVIEEQTWADWTPEKIDAYAKLLADAARVVKAGAKQKKTLPAPKAKAAPTKVEDIPVDPPAPSATEKLPVAVPVFGELEVDREYTQEDGDRGLWWYGYRNQWGTHFAHPFRGDWKDVLEARKNPGCVTIGPFRLEGGQKAAEKVVAQRAEGLLSLSEQVAEEQAAEIVAEEESSRAAAARAKSAKRQR